MKSERISQITIHTSLEAEEPVSALLETLFGQPASAYENVETGESRVTVYVKSEPAALRGRRGEIVEGLQALREMGLEAGPGEIVIRRVPREDWSESWKKFFKTISIGSSLLIKPGWSKREAKPGQAVVVLDPGMSFGTGQHATTSFCLREIVRGRPKAGGGAKSFLDMGTGSGILAIAAAKLGYKPVEAFDFDPVAVRVAAANCRRNRVPAKVAVRRQDLTKLRPASRKKYDLICANLMANLLLAERNKIVQRLAPGGTLVLAGILASEFAQVAKAYTESGLELIRAVQEREWQSGSFRRRA